MEPMDAEPEDHDHMHVGWLDERTRKKIQKIFSTYLIGKSASDLLVLAEGIEEETTEPEGKGSSSSGSGGASSWYAPFGDGDYGGGDYGGGDGSGGGDWG